MRLDKQEFPIQKGWTVQLDSARWCLLTCMLHVEGTRCLIEVLHQWVCQAHDTMTWGFHHWAELGWWFRRNQKETLFACPVLDNCAHRCFSIARSRFSRLLWSYSWLLSMYFCAQHWTCCRRRMLPRSLQSLLTWKRQVSFLAVSSGL